MGDHALRRTAWLLVALTGACAVAQGVLLAMAGVPLLSAAALADAFPIVTAATVVGAGVGAVIVERHPRHRIGWLFCVGQAGAAVGLALQQVPLPLAGGAARLVSADYALALLGFLLLTVPDGRLPSRRWRGVAALLAGGWALSVVALLITPVKLAADLTVIAGLVGAATALLVRMRRARGAERRQLRWIATAATALAGALVLLVVDGLRADGPAPWPLLVVFHLGYLAVPVATGFAVLRYRLYDIDVIIGRTVRLAALALFVTVGYVVAVVAVGTVLGGTLLPSVVAYVVVALAFQPLRRRVDRLADRVVHGDRAAPYDSLAALSRGLREVPTTDVALLRLVARSAAAAAGATAARATAGEVSAGWPDDGVDEPAERLLIRHRGEVVGRIAVSTGRPRLLADIAAAAGLALHNVALTAQLRARAAALAAQQEELAASRRRLRAAVDTERERVATAIRTRVAVHLAPMPAALSEPPDPARFGELREATERAIAALREVTAGVLPPLLARRGARAGLTARPGRLTIGPGVADRRFDPSLEATAYLCCVAALDAAVELREGCLVVTPARPVAWPAAVLDRVAAVGGQVDPVAVRLPVAAQTSTSRSGPNADLVM